MNLITLAKRITALETTVLRQRLERSSICPSGRPVNQGKSHWVAKLEALAVDAQLIMERAKALGALHIALASIRTQCCILELEAKLSGDLDERHQTNLVNVNLDPETAKRMAETYLARRKYIDGGR